MVTTCHFFVVPPTRKVHVVSCNWMERTALHQFGILGDQIKIFNDRGTKLN